MKNAEYWRQRFEQLEDAQNKMTLKALPKIEKQYNKAQAEIEREIARWYGRLAKNNGVTLADARKLLDKNELKEFRWTVEEYIKRGEENAIDGRWIKELENASAKFHISRYEVLKIQMENSLQELFAAQQGAVKTLLQTTYQSGYFHTAFEIQKGFGIGFEIAGVDQARLEKILAKPWGVDNYNFSERIWRNKNKLINEVQQQLTRNLLTSGDPQKAINAIAKRLQVSRSSAGRLVMTESTYFSSLSQRDCFNDLGVEEYEIVATIDAHTSDVCRSLDTQHFPLGSFEPGVTAPPFHPWCRTTTAPYFEDDFGEIGEKAARDEDGKTCYIPETMNYEDWKKSFVDGDKSVLEKYGLGLTDGEKGGIIKAAKTEAVKNDVHEIGKIDIEKYKCITPDITTDEVVITQERIDHINDHHPGDYKEIEPFLGVALKHPDYILYDAKHKDTGIILKHIEENGARFQMVLKIHTSTDDPEYKNSLISAWKISEERWKSYVNNKKILYKSE